MKTIIIVGQNWYHPQILLREITQEYSSVTNQNEKWCQKQ